MTKKLKTQISIEEFSIPYNIFDNHDIRDLQMTIDEFDLGNYDELLPGYVDRLIKLKKLHFFGILISDKIFIKEICTLSFLETLTLMYAQITKIPEEISKLKKLTNLTLRANGISIIPETVSCLPKLKSLNLMYNNITEIPESILKHRQLQTIDITGNKLNAQCIARLESDKNINVYKYNNEIAIITLKKAIK